MSARCEQSDLLVDECAHCQGIPTITLPIAVEGTWVEAHFGGECGGCGRRIHPGDDITKAQLDDAGDDIAWCHVECTRSAVAAS